MNNKTLVTPNRPSDFYRNILRQLDGLFVVMNKESVFIYSNHYTAKMFGYEKEDEILGLNAFGMRCSAVQCAEDFIAQDQAVIESGKTLSILDIHGYADGDVKILLTKKIPYYENEKIAGSICHCVNLSPKALSQITAVLIQTDQHYFPNRRKTERSYII